MAIHTELEIFKAAYDLLAHVVKITRSIPRDFKDSLGKDVRVACTRLTVLIQRANMAADKSPYLIELLEWLQVAEVLLRICRDMQLIPNRGFGEAIRLTQSIGKQANGWRTDSQKRLLSEGQGHQSRALF